MRSIHHPTTPFEWAPGLGGWDLRGERGAVARLVAGERTWLAEAGDAAWTLQRVGFHRPRVVVRPLGGLAEVAHLQADWRGLHALRFAGGPAWEIDPTHSGGTVLRDEHGHVLARLAWSGRLDLARVAAEPAFVDERFGPLALACAGYLHLSGADRTGRVAVGVPFGETARAWLR